MGYRKHTRLLSASGTSAATIIAATDAADFSSFSVQLAGTFVGTALVEVSNDNSNWVAARTQNVADATQISGALSAAGVYRGPITAQYVRVRVSAYTSGTIATTLFLSEDVFTSVVKST